MKKIILLMLVFLGGITASANNPSTNAMQENCNIQIYLQIDQRLNMGSTVSYYYGGKWYTEELSRTSTANFITIPKGSHLEISLLIAAGGTLYATDYAPRLVADPCTDTFIYPITDNEKIIYIRLE